MAVSISATDDSTLPRRRRLSRALVGVAASAIAFSCAMASEAFAAPGVPADPVTVYAENFENGMGTRPVLLTDYVGAPPISETYTADPEWLTQCNGVLVEFNSPDSDQADAGCAAVTSYGRVRQLAWAIGVHGRAADPTTNHSVSAYTEGDPGAGSVEFETVSDIALPGANGRYVTFSVDAAAVNCQVSAPLYQFYLTSAADATPVGGLVNACTSSRTVDIPAKGVTPGLPANVGTYTSSGAVLFEGAALGIRMTNANASGAGNDAAFDNIRILDVTPTLDKSFSPAVLDAGQTATLTFTVTNTSELAAKPGWSFTDNLPDGLVVANPSGATTTCTDGSVTAAAGGGSIDVRGDLDAGQASCTVSVDVTSPAPGRFTNGPGNVRPRGLNPPADSTVHFRGADLSVVKTATSTPAIPGTSISYRLVVRNAGPDAAINARVTDALPAGLTFQSASPGCAASGQNVTCTLGNLAAGGSQTFTVTASVDSQLDAGELTNTATTSSETPDPKPSDNTSTTRVPVEPQADLAIVKRALSSRPVPGRNLTYELTVTNNGPSPARDVRVTDPLPRGLSFVSASEGCRFESGTVTCTVAALESGRSVTFRVVTRVASSVTGGLANTATVESPTRDPEPSNNRDTEEVPPGPEADLSITKVASVDRVAVGSQLFYTLVVRNDGPSDAQNVVVTDAAGAGLTLLSARGSQGACSVEAGRVTCRLGTLAAGGTAQVLVSARADQVGELVNSATVESPTEDPDPRDNRDERRVTGDPPPATPLQPADLEIVKTSNRRATLGAQSIRYKLAVRNVGPGSATGAQVIDTPSLPVRIVSVRSSVGRCSRTVPIRCDLGTLRSGDRATVMVVAQPRAPGTLRNGASVTGDVPDPDAANNIDGTATRVRGLLRIRKAASTTRIRAGGTLSYRIRVTNASSFALRSVRVCDDLPSGLVFVSSTPRSRLSRGRHCWTIRALGARMSRTFTVRARVLRGTSGRKVNTATATAPGARGARSRAAADTAPIQVIAGRVRSGGVTG
jgi:uncharacterized repeat protein (TIGR01451 family)